jgi:hypothetical protein
LFGHVWSLFGHFLSLLVLARPQGLKALRLALILVGACGFLWWFLLVMFGHCWSFFVVVGHYLLVFCRCLRLHVVVLVVDVWSC